jgi:hypothetical protein
MDFLIWSIGNSVLELVQFTDKKVEDRTMKTNRLIVPGQRRIRKWFTSLLNVQDSTTEHSPDSTEGGSAGISSGTSFGVAKDPEHLPPANAWERASDIFRGTGRTLGSLGSAFGFRVACATMSIGILAYLENKRAFFLEQRLVWAMIMVAIGITVIAESGVFGFIGRITGTCTFSTPPLEPGRLRRKSYRYVHQHSDLVHCERSRSWRDRLRIHIHFH